MPELIPFRSYHYREGKDAIKLKELVAPPYDVISKEELIEMKKHPDNICHVILPEKYDFAGEKLIEMINNGTLIANENRCLCIYGIDYIRPDTGESISRYGFVGLLKLVEIFPATNGVIPHEATFKKSCEDRMQIIQKTDSNFSPIFMIYNGNGSAENIIKKYIRKKPSLQTIDKDGFTHKIWEVWKEEDVRQIQEIVKKNSIIIADGHHRYITCLRHSRHGGCKYIMALFIDFNDPGLIIFTSHREIHKLSINSVEELKKKLKKFFKMREVDSYEKLKELMNDNNKNRKVFGCYYKNKYFFIDLREEIKPEDFITGNLSNEWKNLNLPILHNILLENCLSVKKEDITFIKDVKLGLEKVNDGKIQALFIVSPTTLEEVQKITQLGEIMPQKSTYFYPKPLSGLVIHRHSKEIE